MIGKKNDEYTKGLEDTIGNLQRELFNTRQILQNEVNDRDRLQLEYNKLLDENKKLSELNYGLNSHISTLQKEKAILLDNKREIRSKELNACKKEYEKLKKERDTLRIENYTLKLDNEHLSTNIERIDNTNIEAVIEMSLTQAIVMVNSQCIIDDEIYYKYNSLLSAAEQLLIFYEKYKFLELPYKSNKEDKNMTFNKQSIIDLQKKLQSKTSKPETEEATKQWFVMPLLVALGYDPYSSDIIPSLTVCKK